MDDAPFGMTNAEQSSFEIRSPNACIKYPETTLRNRARVCLFLECYKVEQALAVRVLDRLVAAADEDAFESDNIAASGEDDNDNDDTRNANAGQPGGQNSDAFGGGGPTLSLAGRVKTNRRRSSSANSLSVSECRRAKACPCIRRAAREICRAYTSGVVLWKDAPFTAQTLLLYVQL